MPNPANTVVHTPQSPRHYRRFVLGVRLSTSATRPTGCTWWSWLSQQWSFVESWAAQKLFERYVLQASRYRQVLEVSMLVMFYCARLLNLVYCGENMFKNPMMEYCVEPCSVALGFGAYCSKAYYEQYTQDAHSGKSRLKIVNPSPSKPTCLAHCQR